MAVVTIKAGGPTNRDASPRVANDAVLEKGMSREAVGTLETSLADSIGSKYIFCQVPSNARIAEIMWHSDDTGATGDVDVGLYQTTDKGGAVVDADFFASALDVNNAALSALDITHEAGTAFGIDDAEKRLWEALGLSTDPNLFYDIVATATSVIAAVSTLTLKARYVI